MVYFCDGCGYQEDISEEAKTPVARKKTTKAKDKEAERQRLEQIRVKNMLLIVDEAATGQPGDQVNSVTKVSCPKCGKSWS